VIPTPIEQFSNNPQTTLAGAISSTSRPVTFSVASAVGFPVSAQYRILIDAEILLVTAGAGTTSWTATTVEGTAAATHADSAQVRHILTAGALDAFVRKDSNEVVTIPQASAAPGSNPASGAFFFVDPADGKTKLRGSAGTITVIGPA
jgi:hypothetical protein